MKKIAITCFILMSVLTCVTSAQPKTATVQSVSDEISVQTEYSVLASESVYLGEELGKCGKNAYATLDSKAGSLIILESGRMYDYYYEDTPWYGEDFHTISVYNGITYIGMEAFSTCKAKYVFIADSVQEIGDYAFSMCKNIQYVFYEGSRAEWEDIEIGEYNEALTEAEIIYDDFGGKVFARGDCGEGVTWKLGNQGLLSIQGNGVFVTAEGYVDFYDIIKEVEIGEGITCIPDDAFAGFEHLKKVTLGKDIKTIGRYAFNDCKLTELKIPDSVTEIGERAFDGNYIFSLRLSSSLEKIGPYAFNGLQAKKLVFPATLKEIGEGAFIRCPVETVYYSGTEEQYGEITVGEYNENLLNAEVVYNYSCISGDANGDGNINVQDVILLAQYCAGWNSAKERAVEEAIDTNGDGNVNVSDVVLLAKFCTGWDVTLG